MLYFGVCCRPGLRLIITIAMNPLYTVPAVALSIWYFFFRRYGGNIQTYLMRKKNNFDDSSYYTKEVKVPIMRGNFIRLLARLTRSLFGRLWLMDFMCSEGGMRHFRQTHFEEGPTFYPLSALENNNAKHLDAGKVSKKDIEHMLRNAKKSGKFYFNTIDEYVSLFKSGSVTPTQLAENAINTLKEIQRLNIVVKYDFENVRKMAAASTIRYKNETTLSSIDGILVVVKDEYPVEGLTCCSGTTFLGPDKCKEDCALVSKLRQLGAIVFGVANMHELGMGTTGNNMNRGYDRCHNPYNEDYFTGGSSSGSAAAVASGIVSVSLGTDGGGSVRIPAGFCGVVGLKPTYGRMSTGGMGKFANTVTHPGPICGNVRDAAAMFALLAGPDPEFPLSQMQPPVQLPRFEADLIGLKIGIDRRWFKDCTSDVFGSCMAAVGHLERSGATLVDVEIAELNECLVAHRITILSEMGASGGLYFDKFYDQLTYQNRILMKMGHHISAIDYLNANKQRTRMMAVMRRLFEGVDALVTPTAAHCAPKAHPGELKYGATNANQDVRNMRYAALGNFTGIPAISIPVGYNDNGLPVGFQVMSSWWREDTAFRVAEYVERHVDLQRPQVYHDLCPRIAE